MLNEQLAEFESKQLNQQIKVLEQQGLLQKLESAKIEQQGNIIILTLIFILALTFFIYRHYLEKKLTHELELRVKQRTQELEELSEELVNANQVKSQFVANMSHEIRTPLTAIVGHAESIIYDDIDEDKVKGDIEIIHSNSLHLLELINDILDLSRIEANKLELDLKPFNLAELIQYLFDIFDSQAQQKGLVFLIEQQISSPCIIEVDDLRLKQILLNLCANAIKFTEKGQVVLGIEWQNEQLIFTITDTGIGLSKEHLAQVFELFTQADNSISRRFGGSGLGLSLSNQLAKLMSGNITAQSRLGKGSTFCFSLPCKRCDNNIVATAPLDEATVDDDVTLFSGTVLLAEDHDDNRRLIARLLSRLGLEVIVASNGKEAVKLCMEHQPSLVLMDIQMPEINGVEAFTKLRALGCHQPIFALTANAMAHEVSQYLEIGFTGHLQKPIERKPFITTIAQYFPVADDENLVKTGGGNLLDANQKHDVLIKKAEQSLEKIDLSDLIVEFKKSLTHDKDELINANNDRQLTKLVTLSHRLSGAAQMFGFSELNQAAQELEAILKQELNSEQPDFNLISELTSCLVDEVNLTVQ
jgi:signal transduction histidine kinase/CheY-like chemotaxis protein